MILLSAQHLFFLPCDQNVGQQALHSLYSETEIVMPTRPAIQNFEKSRNVSQGTMECLVSQLKVSSSSRLMSRAKVLQNYMIFPL